MKTLHKHTKAFTMLELVFVIVVLGILAALALPRMDRDLRQEAKDNILSAIRYTQHLALMDNKTNPLDANWQRIACGRLHSQHLQIIWLTSILFLLI